MPYSYRVTGKVEIGVGEIESAVIFDSDPNTPKPIPPGLNEEITFAIEGHNTRVWYDKSSMKFKISTPAPSGGVIIHYRIAV